MQPSHHTFDSRDEVQWSDKSSETRLDPDKNIRDFADDYAHEACKFVSRKRSHSYSGYEDPFYYDIDCSFFGKKSDLKISQFEQPAKPSTKVSREDQPPSLCPPSAPPARSDIHDEDGKGFSRNRIFNAIVLIMFLICLVANGVMCYSIHSSKNEVGEVQASFTSKLNALSDWSENEIMDIKTSVTNLNKSSQNKEIPKSSRTNNFRVVNAANRIVAKGCQRPVNGCRRRYYQHSSVDCDGDGALDHVCTNTFSNNRWLVLSSEGCPNSWGTYRRSISECSVAFSKCQFLTAPWFSYITTDSSSSISTPCTSINE